jgi:hypothetical protein
MAVGKGVDVLTGIRKATTWGTSVAVEGTGFGFRATEFSWDETMEQLPDESYNADALNRHTTNVGRYSIGGSFTINVKYEGFDTLFALFLGTAGVPTGSNPYVHTWIPKNDMSGLFATLCWYDGIKTHEVDSVKITGLKFSATAGRRVQCVVTWIGRRRQEDTGTNPSLGPASTTTLTEDTTIDYVQMLSSIVTYQSIAHNGTLAAIELSKWEIDWQRMYDNGDDRGWTSTGAPYIREPMAGAFTCKGSITFPYEAVLYLNLPVSGTLYELKLTHQLSASAIMVLLLPSLNYEKATLPLADKAGMALTMNFRGDRAVTAPTGFAQVVPYMSVTNTNSADALA